MLAWKKRKARLPHTGKYLPLELDDYIALREVLIYRKAF
jgi:hypothetical protein